VGERLTIKGTPSSVAYYIKVTGVSYTTTSQGGLGGLNLQIINDYQVDITHIAVPLKGTADVSLTIKDTNYGTTLPTVIYKYIQE
jgi:hypothetical protein